jgi:hypothetical protein
MRALACSGSGYENLMLRINDHDEIKARGGRICGDDDFEIVRCKNCGCQYLYNSEVLDLYYDPQDLRKRYLNMEGHEIPPCRQCHVAGWDFEELSADDGAEVVPGPWSWLLKS